MVTAPTCGSSGVVPAVLYHLATSRDFLRIRILRALATAGLFGNVAKTNSSISGAEVGCQGEVGVACAMAPPQRPASSSAAPPSQIEYAAEMGLEHHLGLTCDPVCGLVQVPCIERNAIAAARALDANIYATLSDGHHLVSYDKVVEVMNETGHNLPSLYRETPRADWPNATTGTNNPTAPFRGKKAGPFAGPAFRFSGRHSAEQPLGRSIAHRLHRIVHIQLLKNALAVRVDRMHADSQLIGNLLRQFSPAYQTQNFPLAAGQMRIFGHRERADLARPIMEQLTAHAVLRPPDWAKRPACSAKARHSPSGPTPTPETAR